MSEATDVLRQARRELETHDWVQGRYAVDERGAPATMSSDTVHGLCLAGAVWRAWQRQPDPQLKALRGAHKLIRREIAPKWEGDDEQLLPGTRSPVVKYNDKRGRTKQEVLDLLTRVIGDREWQ